MPKRLVLILLVISFASFLIFVYFHLASPPPGVESKGEAQSPVFEYVSLATGLVTLATSIVGLIRDVRKTKQGS
jgi:hypothetical protein